MADLDELLQQHFGFDEFRPGQREVCEHLLAGRSAAALFPTGGGKSLCYQLPALALSGLTVVVSPLIALMKDQIDALQARGIAARRLDSTLSASEVRETIQLVRAGALRLLYVAPERFNNERFRQLLIDEPVALFAVDEAHCISEWGHNFRPDYLKLADFARECGAERVLALTATATPKVMTEMCTRFGIEDEAAVRTGFYRPNLTLLATPVTAKDREEVLLHSLAEEPRGPTIVYVTLQRTAEAVASRLTHAGFAARSYHAGMKPEQRTETQDWFFATPDAVVVATIAFGMGIDKADIRRVVHYNLPKSLENYSQEVGRAGRDGLPSVCEMLVCWDDLPALENFVYGDTPSESAVRSFVEDVLSQEEHFDVGLHSMSADHDIRILVLKTLLTYLELDGLLIGGTPVYASYRFQPQLSSGEIFERVSPDRAALLRRIFRHAKKGTKWFTLDPAAIAGDVGASREQIVQELDRLGEEELLVVESQQVRNVYHRAGQCDDPDALIGTLCRRMEERETLEIGRLRQVLDLIRHDGCQVGVLGAYFGEPRDEPCGHCGWCLNGRSPLQLAPRPESSVDPETIDQALSLRDEKKALADPRALTRFLCGLTSPRLTRAKLTKHPLFGALSEVPFPQVRTALEVAVGSA